MFYEVLVSFSGIHGAFRKFDVRALPEEIALPYVKCGFLKRAEEPKIPECFTTVKPKDIESVKPKIQRMTKKKSQTVEGT